MRAVRTVALHVADNTLDYEATAQWQFTDEGESVEERTESTQGSYINTESELTTEHRSAAAGPPDARESREERVTTERTAAHRAPESETEDEPGQAGA
jgi:hypothetical protein